MDTPNNPFGSPDGDQSGTNGQGHNGPGNGGPSHNGPGENGPGQNGPGSNGFGDNNHNYNPYASNESYNPYDNTPFSGETDRPRGPEDSPRWGQQGSAPGSGYGATDPGYGAAGSGYGAAGSGYGAGGPGNGGYNEYGGSAGYGGYDSQAGGYDNYGNGYWQGQGQNAAQGISDGTEAPGVKMPGGDLPPVNPVVAGPTKISISEAFSSAFRYLNRSIGAWLGAMAIFLGVMFVILIVYMTVLASSGVFDIESDPSNPGVPDPGDIASVIGSMFFLILIMIVWAFLMQVFSLRGGFEVVDGRLPSFGSFFKVDRWLSLLGVYVVMGVIGFLAMLPGLVVIIFGAAVSNPDDATIMLFVMAGYALVLVAALLLTPLLFVMPMLVMDGRATALGAPAVAWRLVKPQFWMVLGASILASLVSSAGTMMFYVGALYTAPLAVIIQVHIYRQLIGGRRVIAPPENYGNYPPQQGSNY